MNLRTGEIAWQQRGFARAQLIGADGKLILLDEDGTLALVDATPKEFRILAQTPLLQHQSWTAPTLSGARLYVRDRRTMVELDLAVK